MPYDIIERNGKYCVVKEDDGSTVYCHDSRAEAIDQIAAIELSETPKMHEELLMLNLMKAEGYKPTSGMVAEAKRGLEWRSEYGRGGTSIGIARARDISNGKNLSASTVKRMFSFFSRHEVDKQGKGWSPGEEGYPSNGRIAWALWGGDPGFSWSRKIANSLKADADLLQEINKLTEAMNGE